MYCENCGTESSSNEAKYCSRCGKMLQGTKSVGKRAANSNVNTSAEPESTEVKMPIVRIALIVAVLFFASFIYFILNAPPRVSPQLSFELSKMENSKSDIKSCGGYLPTCKTITVDGYAYPIQNPLASSTVDFSQRFLGDLSEKYQSNGNIPLKSVSLFDEKKLHEQIFLGLDVSGSVQELEKTSIENGASVTYTASVMSDVESALLEVLVPDADIFIYHYGPSKSENSCNKVLRLHYTRPVYDAEVDFSKRFNKFYIQLGDKLPPTTTSSKYFDYESNSKEDIIKAIRDFYYLGLSNASKQCHNTTIVTDLLDSMADDKSLSDDARIPVSGRTYMLASDGAFYVGKSAWISPTSVPSFKDELLNFDWSSVPKLCTSGDRFVLVGVREDRKYLEELNGLFDQLLPSCSINVRGYNN